MKILSFFNKIKQNLRKLYENNKKLFFMSVSIFSIIIIVGIVYLSSLLKTNETSKSKVETTKTSSDYSYSIYLENKIIDMLTSLDSVSKAKVFVMLDGSEKKYYLKETSTSENSGQSSNSNNFDEKIVYEKSGTNTVPVVVSTEFPNVVGVMIILNKISPSTKLSITNALSVVLNIDSSCISILQEG